MSRSVVSWENHVRRHAALARQPQPHLAQDVEEIRVDRRGERVAHAGTVSLSR